MQAAGHLVALPAKLAARVQHGQADLHRRALQLGMQADRKASAVVGDAQGTVRVQRDPDVGAVAGKGFVDGVVHDLIDQVVKSVLVGRSDVHPGPFPDRLQPFQNLYLFFIVRGIHVRGHRADVLMIVKRHAIPLFLSPQGSFLPLP